MKITQILVAFLFFSLFVLPVSVICQTFTGLDTNGSVFGVERLTGTLTEFTAEPFGSFVLGATVRRGNSFVYVAKPSGSSLNTLYLSNLRTKTLKSVTLDRNEDVRALIILGTKIFAVFYNGNAGTMGLYNINSSTGVTTLKTDLSGLNVEPIAGAFALRGGSLFMLVSPETDSAQRQILRLSPNTGKTILMPVINTAGVPVLCEKIKFTSLNRILCLASTSSETKLHVCQVTPSGRATCSAALPGITRVGDGHTLITGNGRAFYAFVYADGEQNNQRLISFNSKGKIISNIALSTIFIGVHGPTEPAR